MVHHTPIRRWCSDLVETADRRSPVISETFGPLHRPGGISHRPKNLAIWCILVSRSVGEGKQLLGSSFADAPGYYGLMENAGRAYTRGRLDYTGT